MKWIAPRPTCVFFLGLTCMAPPAMAPAETSPYLREETMLVVNGSQETWRLEWQRPPVSECGPEDESSYTCPCMGFAYGEKGPLDLVRLRSGKELERLSLTPFFTENDGAVLQKWATRTSDMNDFSKSDFASQIPSRPIVRLIHLADYNHDGVASEFFLQTNVAPCGKRLGIVVGISAKNPHMHAFGSKAHPEKPLVLQKREWDALLQSKTEATLVDWPCGDHGSESLTEITLRATNGDISALRKEYACQGNGERGKLLDSKPL